MKKVLLLFIIINHSLLAQDAIDSSIKFHHQIEKQLFSLSTPLGFDEKIALALFVEANVSTQDIKSYKAQLQSEINYLKAEHKNKDLSKKQLKTIFKAIKDRFLQHYNKTALLSDAFESAHYNCNTGTILYALVLESLGIPFEIRERPAHVYIIVQIENKTFRIESTKENGVEELDKKYAVKVFKRNKIITKSEYESTPVSELYQKYCKGLERTTGFKALVGNLYYNASLYEYELRRFKTANQLYLKAQYLHPNRQNYDFDWSKQRLHWLVASLKTHPHNAQEDILFVLNNAATSFLGSKNTSQDYEVVYRFFTQNISKQKYPDLHFELEIANFSNLAYAAFKSENYDLALNYMERAYELKPNDAGIQSFICQLVQEKILEEEIGNNRANLLKRFNNRFPCLKGFEFSMLVQD